jgi:AcrR family transcriptional regulator
MSIADRKAERRELFLEAAFDLLGTDGWSATTVRAVIERTGLNPRYFYESFTGLDELLVAVYDHVVDQLGEVVVEALDSAADPESQVRAVVQATVDFVDEDRRRGRVLYAEGLGNEALNLRRLEAGHAVVAFIEQYAAERGNIAPAVGEIGDPIGRVGAAVVVGGFSQLLIDWLDGRVPVKKETLVADATELFLALGDAAGAIASRRTTRTGPSALT